MPTVDQLPEAIKSRIVMGEGCWLWLGPHNDQGYSHFYLDRKHLRMAHRVIMEFLNGGPFAKGIDIDHLCRNTGCVNPSHLEPVTHRENIRRGKAATKMACKYGHGWHDPKNIFLVRGIRRCAVCRRINVREFKRRKRCLLSQCCL